ncbi:sigma-70 family RNA polymerase sigma factor [Cumulibacter manganitolerans]|uniref:sigma-70 family RNA polymerase sigma factor n=1 Tax=Cumulibacter manganitolerans TaxID=1884992 RepID=UPI001E38DCED|nr:sigma-70 family RNA polymerase sigma factor [Cumulibacter manganitolerans]
MTEAGATDSPEAVPGFDPEALLPVLRRVIGARVASRPDAEDLVQEALARMLKASDRIDPQTAEAYAITTARNLIATRWRDEMRFRERRHQLVEVDHAPTPEDSAVDAEDGRLMAEALSRFSDEDRALLLAHEVDGVPNAELADRIGSTAGAVGARLHRLRMRMRVEYLLIAEGIDPPTTRCRSVLYALASNDRRRRRESDVEGHLLECDTCYALSTRLQPHETTDDGTVRLAIERDADLVQARQAARELAAHLGFAKVELTVIATAVSEMARNVLKFAGSGTITLSALEQGRRGFRVVVADRGPGIPDLEAAVRDGYSTYRGLGLGLGGARRLMDEFDVVSRPGRGTIVTMTKWLEGNP